MVISSNIRVRANRNARTFTIRLQDDTGKTHTKYRTIKLPVEEFRSCLHNTENDWRQLLKADDYYKIK